MPHELLDSQRQYTATPFVDEKKTPGAPVREDVITMFELQADRTPDAIAVVFHGQQLTYRQLNEQANQLARYLQQQGITAESPVPVCLHRSPALIMAVLAVLKAGAAYVPLDPDYPQARLLHILHDTQYTLMITDEQSRHQLPAADKVIIPLNAPEIQERLSVLSAANQEHHYHPDRCTYIIYTSGSTGTPKGIQMPDSALSNLLLWQRDQVDYTLPHHVLQFASINFDVSFQEIFFALCFGGCLHLITEEERKDMAILSRKIISGQINCLFLPYIVLQSLAVYAADSSLYPGALLDVFTAGEQLKLGADLQQFMEQTGARLHNQYGPSEAHVVTSYTVQAADYQHRPLPPVGRPVYNTVLYIVDEQGHLCPAGTPGELYIGGVQVARGYLHRPELTADRFIADPFTPGGGRLYKSGDICCLLPDGNIEYISRKDDQVKIRGYRIEPGEIESVIGQSGLVTQAVVMVKEDVLTGKKIVAYVVLKEQAGTAALRAFLADRLPDYMMPAVFMALPHIPVTSNGKADKRALPEPDAAAFRRNAYTAPRTATEETLAQLWTSLLQLPAPGIHDHFFELGGHSLLAMRLQSLIRRHLQKEISVKELFAHPTIAQMAELTDLREHCAQHMIGTEDRPALMPLSFSQERLFFIDQLEGSVQYHMPLILRLKGNLNTPALEQALQYITDRHEVLRTVIHTTGTQHYQHILEKGQWRATVMDIRNNPGEAGVILSSLIEKPFNLSQDHPLRAHIIRVEDADHLLLLTMHHIASDGWSLQVLTTELKTCYETFCAGGIPELPMLEIQYADYARWQQTYLTPARQEAQLQYWRSQLAEAVPLQLPADFPRAAIQRRRGATVPVNIDKTLTAQLQQLSQAEGATLFMTLLTAFNVLLHRYSGQQDICVGIPVSGRLRQETESLIGFFINSLALRSDVQPDLSFRALLSQVKQTTLDAYAWQEVPFEKVVEAVVKERDASRSPLFQVMFVLQNMPESALTALGEMTVTTEQPVSSTSKFDLTFQLEESAGGLIGRLEYCTDLFLPETVLRMAAHFQALLQAIVLTPDSVVAALPLSAETDMPPLQGAWNATAADFPRDRTVVQLFREQAALSPSAAAIMTDDITLSYAMLDHLSDQAAQQLHAAGCGSGGHIGLLSRRGPEMIIAMMGILKSGNAYVPFHIDYPAARLRTMMEDAGIKHIFYTDEKLFAASEVPADAGIALSAAATFPQAPLPVTADSNATAYIMYTSGTSGRPKGIAVSHRNIAKLAYETGPVALQPGDVLLQWSNYAFDGSVYEIFGTLLQGAAMCLIRDEEAADIAALSRYIRQYQVTHCFMTTALFNSFADTGLPALQCLRRLMFGGEAVSVPHVHKAFDALGPGKLVHVYGPTETTVFATWHLVNNVNDYTCIPIGRPLSNTQVLVLDQLEQPVPAGIPGELYIGGEGVTAGYVSNPELSAAKFRTPACAAGRWYKTGDIVRQHADGALEYISRKDDQVKIRGYRIETGEIEQALLQCAAVTAALVVAPTGADGVRWLLAYVIPAGPFDAAVLTAQLESRLPAYMIPAVIMPVEKWPLTVNGKIDRKALPQPEQPAAQRSYTAPVTHAETVLTAIWESLLPVKPIGIHDNFFSLGGHSLLVTRVVAAIRQQLETELTIQDVFTHPTIHTLAAYMEGLQKGRALPPLTVQPRPEKIPLSFAQARLWFLDRMQGSVNYHIPDMLLLEGELDISALEQALQAVVERHEVLRTVFSADEDGSWQQVLPAADWQLQHVTASFENMEAVTRYAEMATVQPFDLTADYLFRAQLIRLPEDRHVLLLVMHHIAADGWSLSVLAASFMELYRAFHLQQPPALPLPPVQYADYTLWQSQHIRGTLLDTQLQYWKQQLQDVSVLQLPADFTRPGIQSTAGNTLFYTIPVPVLGQLEQLSRQEGTTLFMTLLAAFKVLLFRYTQQEDICVGSPVAHRTHQETEQLIGFFVNTLALRSDLSGDPAFRTLLAAVKATLLDAYMHQDAPFEQVVDAVAGGERDRSRTPLFQVMFIQQNLPDIPDLALQDLRVSRLPVPIITSKFDLTVETTATPAGLQLRVEYCSDLYEADTILRMMQQYEQLLLAIIAAPESRIGSLPLLTPAATQQVLHTFNDTCRDRSPQPPVITLFEMQAARTPDAVALSFGAERMTYRTLNEKANRIAHYLQQQGVREHTFIPVCMQRSMDLIVAITAILKTGAAYVPVDPGYPAARIRHILQDTAYPVLLTDESCYAIIAAEVDAEKLLIPAATDFSGQTTDNPLRTDAPHRCTYLIYTSGSTGTPKGVQMPDSALSNLLLWQRDQAGYEKAYTVLQFASINFDVSFQEIFFTLCFGGELRLIAEQERKDMPALMKVIHDAGVTSLFLPYVVLQSLAVYAVENNDYPQRLYDVFTAGEQLKLGRDIEQLMTACGAALHNQYGPSETHVVTAYTIRPEDYRLRPLPPIGKPVDNTMIYILSPDGNVCPVGVPGELYIGGAQVALGYLHLPELTAGRFMDNPFHAGGRLYRSGDICRWLADGNIEYIGRRDEQVKIRGYRIEPGEIEKVLQASPQVKHACVTVHGTDTASRILVAYIVPDGPFHREAIMEHLREQLPAHMIPALLMELEQLPVTPNGKVNKRALPAPDWNAQVSQQPQEPRSKEEALLTDIWKSVLQLENIGIHQGFFESGGNSIIAIRLIAKMQAHFQVSINDLFMYPTIAGIARHVVYRKDYFSEKLAALAAMEDTAGAAPADITTEELCKQEQAYADQFRHLQDLPLDEKLTTHHVLLLGATGFLGIYLLRELLQRSSCTIHTIVRAGADAFERLSEKYAFYFGETLDAYRQRLHVMKGDLSQPCLGLEQPALDACLQQVDSIINAAANVKHYGSYASFEAANIHPVEVILQHYPQHRNIVIHHMSTTGIAGAASGSGHLFTEADMDRGQPLSNFYLKSKMAAERLLAEARNKGIPVNIYRVGHLSFDSVSGIFQENIENNAFCHEIKGYVTLGAMPGGQGLEMSNIDQVAAAILLISERKALLNGNYHVLNSRPLPAATFAAALSSYGYPLTAVPAGAYYTRMLAMYDTHRDMINRLLLDASIFNEEPVSQGYCQLRNDATDLILQRLGFHWPEINEQQIHLMLDYLRQIAFMTE
ncbi:non-ribosomal peptide synthetase [Chitinophaga solisilvae]|uniref:non-ribosomal peptide synthetase n=1 Tax=Chitinophaga solisilvae TaxID=1233460 RepID=UPI0013681F8A|nr:non-ribosomal peptide synthetase [Chitinophaga solisilvae]